MQTQKHCLEQDAASTKLLLLNPEIFHLLFRQKRGAPECDIRYTLQQLLRAGFTKRFGSPQTLK